VWRQLCLPDASSLEIHQVACDSRKVRPAALFFCLARGQGRRKQIHSGRPQARRRGDCERRASSRENLPQGVAWIKGSRSAQGVGYHCREFPGASRERAATRLRCPARMERRPYFGRGCDREGLWGQEPVCSERSPITRRSGTIPRQIRRRNRWTCRDFLRTVATQAESTRYSKPARMRWRWTGSGDAIFSRGRHQSDARAHGFSQDL